MVCKKNLCPICNSKHDKNHNVIDYDEKLFTCESHNEPYNLYCDTCKKDLCMTCQMEQKEHEIISYGTILPDVSKIKEETKNFCDKKEKLKNEIKEIIQKLNNLVNILDKYYGIYIDIINSYDKKKRNHSLLQNIDNITKNTNEIIEDINQIINKENINEKLKDMFNIYDKMTILNNSEDNNVKSTEETGLFKIIEINKELLTASEKKEENKFKDLDVSKLKKILSFKTEIDYVKRIFVLNDGRIMIFSNPFTRLSFCVVDLKNKKSFTTNINDIFNITDIFQMDDGVVIMRADNGIKLLDIKDDRVDVIKKIYVYNISKIFKSNQKILSFADERNEEGIYKKSIYNYKNKNLELVEGEKELKSMKKIEFNFDYSYLISENEILIAYFTSGIFSDNHYISFYDIEKDKKIQNISYNCDYQINGPFCKINSELLLFAVGDVLYPIDIKHHKKKKEYKFENFNRIYSIMTLNENQFLVAQTQNINQFVLDKDNRFKLIKTIDVFNDAIALFSKNRVLFGKPNTEKKDIIELYG